MNSATLFDLEPFTKEVKPKTKKRGKPAEKFKSIPDWEDMKEDDDRAQNSSHVGTLPDKVDPTCELIYQWVELYPVKSTNYYYRYSYIDKFAKIPQVVKHHIPGGNTKTPLAINRKNEIENAINCGAQPTEIEAMIKAWKKHKNISGNK